jgi:hypothetical protein
MNDIVMIAPFEELGRMAKKIIDENKLDVDVLVGNLSEGVEAANKAASHGARVLISRGGTYKMIKDTVDLPVVEIKMSSFDILRGFKDLGNYKGKIGVVGYKNIISGCEAIGYLLSLNTELIEIEEESEALKLIGEAVDRGIKVFIGDTIGARLANQFHCQSYRIESGNEAIISAIQGNNPIVYRINNGFKLLCLFLFTF